MDFSENQIINSSHGNIPNRACILDVIVSENVKLKLDFKDETKYTIIKTVVNFVLQ